VPRDLGDLDAGQYGSGNDESFRYSTFGRAWRAADAAGHGVLNHLSSSHPPPEPLTEITGVRSRWPGALLH
jgi:hypothetical protein